MNVTTTMSPTADGRAMLPDGQSIGDFVPLLRIDLAGFRLIDGNPRRDDGSAWIKGDLQVLASAAVERDGHRWLHVSLSRQGRLPSWDDITLVKQIFIGDERLALQVFPPQAEYVNIHPHVLHLWCCIDARPVPDFRHSIPLNGERVLGI